MTATQVIVLVNRMKSVFVRSRISENSSFIFAVTKKEAIEVLSYMEDENPDENIVHRIDEEMLALIIG